MCSAMISSWSLPMSADWRKLSRASKLETRANGIRVTFEDGRKQLVCVDDEADGRIRIWSLVSESEVVCALKQTNIRAWLRNRLSELVGFKMDERGRLIGEASVPV